jgi:predicted transcriptional regulator
MKIKDDFDENEENVVVDQRKNWESRVEMNILNLPKEELGTYDKLLYTLLCGYANYQKIAFPSVKRLANGVSCSIRQIYTALRVLEEAGLVIRKKRFDNQGAQIGNIYEIYGANHYVSVTKRVQNGTQNVLHKSSIIPSSVSPKLTIPEGESYAPSADEQCAHPPTEYSALGVCTGRIHNSTSINRSKEKNKKTTLPTGEGEAPLSLSRNDAIKRDEIALSQGHEFKGDIPHSAGNRKTQEAKKKIAEMTMLLPFEDIASETTQGRNTKRTDLELQSQSVPCVSVLSVKTGKTSSSSSISIPDIPAPMRETADYFLLKTGRPEITAGELSALRALEEIHTPSRVNAEITTAVGRFRKNGKPLANLTLEYIYDSLKYQVSRKDKESNNAASKSKFDANGKKKVYEPWIERIGEKYKDCYLDSQEKIDAWIEDGKKQMEEKLAREKAEAEKKRKNGDDRVLLWVPTPYAGLGKNLPVDNVAIANYD